MMRDRTADSPTRDLLSLHRFSSNLLQRVAGDDRKGNVLVLGHGALPAPECPCLRRDEHTFGLAICIFQGRLQSSNSVDILLDCASMDLPFQDAVFRRVILYLVTRDGTEQELDEACRVLAPDGELVVLGLNHRSWSGIRHYRRGPVPRMHVASVKNRLHTHDMVIDRMLGSGLLGQAKPLMEGNRLSSFILPLADLIVLRARHRERGAAMRLRVKEFPARALPTAFIATGLERTT